ncbi:hypothetical protein B484DRAFT_212414 [Ochromonadaceae sp. CCMP2298]|nr:hypothetical protein B484DRAFT_212414 [Ochromonadaceae sp. CCMP2298]
MRRCGSAGCGGDVALLGFCVVAVLSLCEGRHSTALHSLFIALHFLFSGYLGYFYGLFYSS